MTTALDVLSGLCLIAGAVFCVISAVGMLRLPDAITRLHAASVADTLGVGLIIVGLMLQSGLSLVTLKLALLALLLFFVSPLVGHAVAQAIVYRTAPETSVEPKSTHHD
ncbi:MAG: monovalent cation/H(+) antiporter subunit G [Pseudomonadales bacterium]|jgi:multicomponent Na+:H+ antiporter subunit G